MPSFSPIRSSSLTRRDLLRAAAGGLVVPRVSTPSRAANPIVAENQKPGTTDWQLTYVRSENHRSPMIEGYCSRASVRPDETITFHLSADPATDVTIDLYRMGYYQGTGGRHVERLGPVAVEPRPDPPVQAHRLRECRWPPAAALEIPGDWTSGVYLGKLSARAHRYQSYVIFIVRDERGADLLFQCSDATWQAYNKWPGEYSLYDSDPPVQPHSARTWVSFDRPYGKYPQVVDQPLSQGSGEFLLWEYPLCFWLEKEGYDVTYQSNIDTHRDGEGLRRGQCFLSVGHDEYWSRQMFDNVKEAVEEGLSAAFLSGNALMWAIEIEPSTGDLDVAIDENTGLTMEGTRPPAHPDPQARSDRIIYREGRFGGVSPEEAATGIMGPFDADLPNENTLIGARTMYPFNGSADWIVSSADHWIFEGTGMQNGDRIRGLVGWEHHGDPADIPGLEIVAEGTTINSGGNESHYTATVYPGPQDSWVFNAATIFWSMGLSKPPGLIPPHSHFGRPHGPDERVRQITANFFRRCGVSPAGQR